MKNLKVLMLNGSPHANGNTAVALREMEEIFKASGVEVETVLIGNQAVRGCTAAEPVASSAGASLTTWSTSSSEV